MNTAPNFVEILTWRGLLHNIVPGTEQCLQEGPVCGYIGFDPTADSLHIGNLTQVMTLAHFQRCGHRPLILVGGATGMIGDPSGKSKERNLLPESKVEDNLHKIEKQLRSFLDFQGANAAEIVNNYSWFKNMRFLDFARDVGKHITVNYMMAKESIQKRLGGGLSFTEFCYQLAQAYDFYMLYKNKGCTLQMGGADQWGNILTGAELIRRKEGGKAFALTTILLQKADGSKFGKTEEGNVWLAADKTSPYAFYQYWLNTADEDATRLIKIFTERQREEITQLISAHLAEPHERTLQKELAKDITCRVHSPADYQMAVKASRILFGNSVKADLEALDESTLLDVFKGIPHARLSRADWEACSSVTELVSESTQGIICAGKGEARRLIAGGGMNINKERINDPEEKPNFSLLHHKYMLVQRGKKTYYLIEIV